MEAVAFDTHSFVKRLTKAGMPEPQAEVLAEEQSRLLEYKLATKKDIAEIKQDIAELRAETKRDIAQVKQDIAEVKLDMKRLETTLKRDIRESEQRMTIRLGGMLVVAVAILATLIKLG